MAEQETKTTPLDTQHASTMAWLATQTAKEAPPAAPPAKEPKAPVEAVGPADDGAEAAEPAPAAEPKTDAVKALAAKLAKPKADAAPVEDKARWDDSATDALQRLGLRSDEMPKLAELTEQNPWLKGFIDGAVKRQSKVDADFAALRSKDPGAREPTSGARGPSAQEQRDQPGSGQVADVAEALIKGFGEELGDDNATHLRQVLSGYDSQIQELKQELRGFAQSAQAQNQAAEIEVMAQGARRALRDDFPWMDDETRFEAVAAEMAGLRPDEITPQGVLESMRKAARIVGYDDLRSDAEAVVSKLDNTRKTRLASTSPNGSSASEGKVLSEYEISLGIVTRMNAGEPKARIDSWAQQQHARRRNAAT